MGFKENINDFFGLCNFGGCPFRITVLGKTGAYVEGVIRVNEVSSSQISVEVKGEKILFLGKGLSIGSFCESDLTVKGEIEKIVWQK